MEKSHNASAERRWQAFMDAASSHLKYVGESHGDDEVRKCAERVVHNPKAWRHWERELGTALRPVANLRTRRLQLSTLRNTAFSWIHRATPFRYLRDHALRGTERRRLIAALHGEGTIYERAMVAEHDAYTRSVCHGLCSEHLGETVFSDPLFGESMHRYEKLYMEYFQTYGAFITADSERSAPVSKELLPLLKKQLAELREAILEYPQRANWLRREAAIRKTTGDTQRLGKLDYNLD
jgi:hypothetical protein